MGYRDLFRANTSNREAALKSALDWWRGLPTPPRNEHDHINNWAPTVSNLLSCDNLLNMWGAQFENLCLHVHAVRDHARQVADTTLGLQHGMARMTKEQRTKVFADYLFTQRSQDGTTCCGVIDFVLYGGDKKEIETGRRGQPGAIKLRRSAGRGIDERCSAVGYYPGLF